MAQKLQHEAASSVTEDNLTELILRQRFKTLQQTNLEGKQPIYKIGIDGGWRKLGISTVVAYERMPDLDPKWTADCLKRTVNPANVKLGRPPYPCHVLFASLTDLIPGGNWDCDPSTHLFESEVATKLVGDFDEKLDALFNQIAERFNRPSTIATSKHTSKTGGIYAYDEPNPGDLYDYSSMNLADRVTAELVDTKALASVDFSKQYTTDLASAHHLTRQLIKLVLLNKKMRRLLWVIPAGTTPENPNDQLQHSVGRKADETPQERKERVARELAAGTNTNRRDPLVYYLTHLLHALIATVDMQLFGAQRTCRLSAKKYGTDCPIVEKVAWKRHPRVILQNTILKKMAVISVLIALRALGQHDLVKWLTVELRNKGQEEIDDVCDSIALPLALFNEDMRTNNYSDEDREKITRWNKIFIKSIRFTGDYVHMDDLSLARAENDQDTVEAMVNAAIRMSDIVGQELIDDISEIEARESGDNKKASAVVEKNKTQKQLDRASLRNKEDDDDDVWLFANPQKFKKPTGSIAKPKPDDNEDLDAFMADPEQAEAFIAEAKRKEEIKKKRKELKDEDLGMFGPPSKKQKKKEEKEEDVKWDPPKKEPRFPSKTKEEPTKRGKTVSPIPIDSIESGESDEEFEAKPRQKRKRQTHIDSDDEEDRAKGGHVINLLDFLPHSTGSSQSKPKQKQKKERKESSEKQNKKQPTPSTKEKRSKPAKSNEWDDAWGDDWNITPVETDNHSGSHGQEFQFNNGGKSTNRLPSRSPGAMANEMDFY